ncbi:hypothetical protein TTHERM_000672149 (macronuclear) [Tetrahymena thermophila SB210]|uniref:Uncharacterized protein n=1 Tax=Tetrahymena thermophila (strain SB210) TaxID=312017 RepID=W7XK39_TETTS|nr:hypothetical protein TTHERM_000672149 [Tetrahymena thermophila SB210]EWS74574.1 hypothetical protein TTHERM_000672149 [Tetrahymena thermophila SB210]|eukprot:XP_012652875.1 hypothetical protein TTHERM_000672149 [Tetrahymena thermophila SB210]
MDFKLLESLKIQIAHNSKLIHKLEFKYITTKYTSKAQQLYQQKINKQTNKQKNQTYLVFLK